MFEDNAEFGYGFAIAHESMRNRLNNLMTKAISTNEFTEEQNELFNLWITHKDDSDLSKRFLQNWLLHYLAAICRLLKKFFL